MIDVFFFLLLFLTSSPGEALWAFSNTSWDPKGESELWVENSTKAGYLRQKTKHTSKTTSKQICKSREIDTFESQNDQKWPLRTTKLSKFLTENFDFRGHLWTFRAENTPKSGLFKTKNKAQTHPKQLSNNFEKVEKATFSNPKLAKNYPSQRPK